MFKKISILTLTLAISLDTVGAFAKPKSKRASSNKKRVAASMAKVAKTETTKTENTATVVETAPAEDKPEVAPVIEAPVEPSANITTTINNYNTNDIDTIRTAVREELNANQNILARNATNEENKKKEAVKNATSELSEKIEETRSACSNIKNNLDTIFGLSTATTISSGLGTLAAGGALGVGIAKSVTDKKLEQNRYSDAELTTLKDIVKYNYDKFKENYDKWDAQSKDSDDAKKSYNEALYYVKKIDAMYKDLVKDDPQELYNKGSETIYFETVLRATGKIMEVDDPDGKLAKKYKETTGEKADKNSKVLGNVRTGLLAGATLTSAVSTGTSIGATVTASKLAEKMTECNIKISELRIATNALKSEVEDSGDIAPSIVTTADNILSACTGFDENNIKTLKTTMTASAVVSGIGTAAAGAGTVTSIMANTDKVRNDDSEKGVKKEKTLNLVSNIAAGVATGTSATSTVLSATAMSKAKKDSAMAENCENALAQ